MSIRICSNGHVSGTRVCVNCGSDKSKKISGLGNVPYKPKSEQQALRQLRAETRVGGRPHSARYRFL